MPTASDQHRWLIPLFGTLTVLGLLLFLLASALEFWWLAATGALVVLSNVLGMFSQLVIRRRARAAARPRV